MGPSTYAILLAIGVVSPFLSFWLLVLFGQRLGKPGAGWFAVAFGMGVPLVCASIVLIGWLGLGEAEQARMTASAFTETWAYIGNTPIEVGIKLDSLTVAMYFMVAFIAFWIFVFSVGYMAGHSDEVDGRSHFPRFFAYLSLFGFSMLGLVISNSLLFLFVFWELVGLCSYLLIGFYFDKGFASAAAMKAFIANRVGDFGFLIGLMIVFAYLGTFNLDQAAEVFSRQAQFGTGLFASNFSLFGWSLATIMGIGLFCGAIGKSAQFPLHVWLPDAMAGPTPVSALIHAATMVAAGVYLVARVFCLMTPEALMVIAFIGCVTLTLMGLVAIVQTDIKKCLAYSTLSQLGYMIFGLGCGAWIAALFHLITHAFFKSMMFLGSGQVIEGCHHEQDMRKMGGLLKKMPVTGYTFLVGVLAISGAGIAGTSIGVGGFFSKDEILAVAYVRAFEWDDAAKLQEHEDDDGQHGEAHAGLVGERQFLLASAPEEGHGGARHGAKPGDKAHAGAQGGDGGDLEAIAAIHAGHQKLPPWMFYLAIFTAYVTPFYMMRCWWMTFMGKPRDAEVYAHAHESPLMYVPLVVLSAGTIISSYFLFRPLLADAANAGAFNAPLVLAVDGHAESAAIHAAHHWLFAGVGFAFAVGFLLAIAIYYNGLGLAQGIKRRFRIVHLVLENKFYFDELYGVIFIGFGLMLSKIARLLDTYFVDLVFDLAAKLTTAAAMFAGRVIDVHGVDGLFNGTADTAKDVGWLAGTPQTGRIRNYVITAVACATVVVISVLYMGLQTGG